MSIMVSNRELVAFEKRAENVKRRALNPDRQKLLDFAATLPGIVNIQVKSQEANEIVDAIRMSLGDLQKFINESAEKL